MKTLPLWLSLVSVVMVGCATGPASDWLRMRDQSEVEKPHAHLLLVGDYGPKFAESKVDAYLKAFEDAAFWSSPGVSSNNPLAPCAMVAAKVISVQLNDFWNKIAVERTIPVPPAGTNILGMFDADIKGGKIPRDDPGKAAEILARLFVWYSWSIDTVANTIIHSTTQEQCLELLLSDPDVYSAKIQGMKRTDLVYSHSPAVAHYSAILPRDNTERFFKDVRREGFMSLSSKGTDNPAAPCSLLRAFRFAGHLTEFHWKAAEINAQHFARIMVRSDVVSEGLIAQATQEECLNEIFQPGLIRMRLLKEGKLPPLR